MKIGLNVPKIFSYCPLEFGMPLWNRDGIATDLDNDIEPKFIKQKIWREKFSYDFKWPLTPYQTPYEAEIWCAPTLVSVLSIDASFLNSIHFLTFLLFFRKSRYRSMIKISDFYDCSALTWNLLTCRCRNTIETYAYGTNSKSTEFRLPCPSGSVEAYHYIWWYLTKSHKNQLFCLSFTRPKNYSLQLFSNIKHCNWLKPRFTINDTVCSYLS